MDNLLRLTGLSNQTVVAFRSKIESLQVPNPWRPAWFKMDLPARISDSTNSLVDFRLPVDSNPFFYRMQESSREMINQMTSEINWSCSNHFLLLGSSGNKAVLYYTISTDQFIILCCICQDAEKLQQV
jgi:hypothetical protein